ncbi:MULTISPECIES: DMT family transporter [unclassified Polaromonas]|jgi:S-adenosylmethionine uptake transporter|uniref:DMT family transporter n=1 Tax=unclassified Polaromonas TaxID=2638319 RepID=UPI000F08693D|nr:MULTISPECIES: DMT family transporter [unclassified Polaromonas]AYQ26629.1 DMT family transporter [Polaromonas sp. SP1]QGJ18525.1 EamA/RhaT family transporter [Polaromonas sp. Pch-P]
MQAVWMILSSFLFATMGVCVKYASEHFNSAELVFYRGVLGILFMAIYARAQGITLRTRYPAMHAWRSVIGVMSLSAWFYAIAHLPLATAMTLNYMSSVWIAAFLVGGALMLGKAGQKGPSQGPLVLAILASFIGVVMLLRPAIDQNQTFAGLVGLMSGLGAAFAYMQVMAIARMGEPETRTVFYFAVGTAVAGALGMIVMGITPWNWQQALWLPPLGILASLGQLTMTKAYSMSENHGGTLMVANLQYSGIVFAAIYSLILFGDNIPLIGWAGMALIIVSAIAATVLRARAAPNAPAEEH